MQQITRRSFSTGLALAAACGLVSGAQAQRAKLLRFGLSAWPPNLQPWVSTGPRPAR